MSDDDNTRTNAKDHAEVAKSDSVRAQATQAEGCAAIKPEDNHSPGRKPLFRA
jgi:hypothetical protein